MYLYIHSDPIYFVFCYVTFKDNISKDICKKLNDIEFVIAQEVNPSSGTLNIATNHTQSKYVLPEIIIELKKKFPNVRINILQGTPKQLSTWLHNDHCDLAIITEDTFLYESTLVFPCYKWHHSIIIPDNHELCRAKNVRRGRHAPKEEITVADKTPIEQFETIYIWQTYHHQIRKTDKSKRQF